ncbi:MAG: hypothetical protein ACR2I8_01925 [Steroidobacteraceae bacterium]
MSANSYLCEFCTPVSLTRVRRRWWMRLVRHSSLHCCDRCGRRYWAAAGFMIRIAR